VESCLPRSRRSRSAASCIPARALEEAIFEYIAVTREQPRPFRWTKTADEFSPASNDFVDGSRTHETSARRAKTKAPGAEPLEPSRSPVGSYFKLYFIRPMASMAFALATSILPALQAASASRTSLAGSAPVLAPAIRGAWTSCVLLRGA
jgi:hypothetical protein